MAGTEHILPVKEVKGYVTNVDVVDLKESYCSDAVNIRLERPGVVGDREYGTKHLLASYPQNPTYNIESITSGTPIVVTITGHPFKDGDLVDVEGVTGATGVNGKRQTVSNSTANTFQLVGSTTSGQSDSPAGGTVRLSMTIRDHQRVYAANEQKVYDILVCIDGRKNTRIFVTKGLSLLSYTVSVTAGPHGTITPGTVTLMQGQSQTFTITPDSGYSVQDVLLDGVSQGPVSSLTVNNIQANHSLSASFFQVFTVTAKVIGNAQMNYPITQLWAPGSTPEYDLFIALGWEIDSATLDGNPITFVPVDDYFAYTFEPISQDHVLAVTVVQRTRTVTIDSSVGTPSGLLNLMGSNEFLVGSTPRYIATPSRGYTWESATLDGIPAGFYPVGSDWYYDFAPLDADHSLVVNFRWVGHDD